MTYPHAAEAAEREGRSTPDIVRRRIDFKGFEFTTRHGEKWAKARARPPERVSTWVRAVWLRGAYPHFMVPDAKAQSSLWIWRFWGRVVVYCLLGGLLGAVSGASQGCIVGGNLAPGVGSAVGGIVGAFIGWGTGGVLYFIAGLLSRPESFWLTFKRVAAFMLLGMAVGGTVGSAGLLATFGFLSKQENPFARWVGVFSDSSSYAGLLIYGGPILMFFGQVTGALCGMKKRWGAREEQLCAGVLCAYWQSGLVGLGTGITAAILSYIWAGYFQRYWGIQPLAGWAGGVTAGVLASFLVNCVSLYLLPIGRWNEINRRVLFGTVLGVLLAIVVSIWMVRPQLEMLWGLRPKMAISRVSIWRTNPFDDFVLRHLPIGMFAMGILSVIPLWLGQWRRARTAHTSTE